MPAWFECSSLVEPEAVDAVAEVFGSYGQGVAIEEPFVAASDGDWVRIEADKPVLVKTYLPLDERTEQRRRHLEEALWHLGQIRQVAPLQVREIQEEDWAEAWKKHFFVHRVGERLVIVPSWRRHRPRAGDLSIRLDPGMAFGTGLHPTTRLCLQALERYVRNGQSVLDLGSGSGILAIAASKLGAGPVLALDVDSVAVEVATENVARNGLARHVETGRGSLPLSGASGPTFDLIVANISFRVLSDLHGELWKALRPGGIALLSGILAQNTPELVGELAAERWQPLEQQSEGDWMLLALARRER